MRRPVMGPVTPASRRGSGNRGVTAWLGSLAALGATMALTVAALPASADPPRSPAQAPTRTCPPSATALSYSDALNKKVVDGVTVGGLSNLAYDARSRSFVSTVDNNATDPARLYSLGPSAFAPSVTRPALVLRRPDGTPYTGTDSDDEGLAVLPDGNYLVSSETEPSIRVFGRDGVQRAELAVPGRFRVTPAGEATANATLEGLTVSPSGRYVVAAMEGTLSGDVPAGGGEGRFRRFLVYERRGGTYSLAKQVAYEVDPGMRVPEVAAYDDGKLLVEEASFSAATGNAVALYSVTGLSAAPDVSGVADLATAPASAVMGKTLVANLVRCPTLGAASPEPQTNPLLDNIEGMAVYDVAPSSGRSWTGPRRGLVSLISDDNFSATQTTRVLTLAVELP